MADIPDTLRSWSATAGSNSPTGGTSIGTGLDDNLRAIQAAIRGYLAGAPANMASASTVELSTATSNYVNITGTTTITAFGAESSGIQVLLKFAGALTLTHHSTSLILPGGNNITTAAGDVAEFVSEGSGNWRCLWYRRAYGNAIVSVKDFGAVGDGVTNDTTAIQAAVTSLTQGQILYFPAGQYLMGQVIFDGKSNVGVSAYGARFTLSGNSAGFLVKGICSGIYVAGGTITGDGVNRDASPSTAQIGWLFGNESGAYVQTIFVQDVIVDSANIGFKFAAGTGGGSGNANYVKVERCQAKDIVGLVSGTGYGFQFSQANNSVISDSVAINCGRHGIYFAEGRNYAAANCLIRDHRSTVYTAAYRVAMSISRSRNVSVSNCVFDNCFDGTIEIDVDTGGTAPDNVSIGTAITNCTFLNSALADIRIGTVPATDGTVYDVTISNCVMVRPSTSAVSSIIIEGGERIKVTDNLIDGTLAAAGFRAIGLNATSGASYTNDVEIVRNTINSSAYGIQIESALQTGSTRVRLLDNKITATTAELEFVGGENATTNNSLIYNRTNGKNASRTYSSSGSNVTIPVGGLDVLTLSAGGATTVSNFSGGTEGQELVCYFTNGNTTLLNTNFFTAGAANFTGTASDTLTMVYIGGAWREKCRSVN